MLPVDPWAPWHAGKRLTINHCPPPKIPHAHLGSNAHIGYGDVVGAGFTRHQFGRSAYGRNAPLFLREMTAYSQSWGKSLGLGSR